MNVAHFLERLEENSTYIDQNAITIFYSSLNASIFLNALIVTLVKKNLMVKPVTLSLERDNLPEMQATLEQSFLGQSTWYSISITAPLDKKTQSFLSYLRTYGGPHHLLLSIESPQEPVANFAHAVMIDLNLVVDKSFFIKLANFFGYSRIVQNQDFIARIFAMNNQLSLDNACMLMRYLELVGARSFEDCFQSFRHIIEPSASLNQLSYLLFSRNPEKFFCLWHELSKTYPTMFWLSFWSQQLWQAAAVVQYSQEKNFSAARRMGSRLPFLFIKEWWRNFSYQELALAHAFLYDIDFNIKSGSQFCALDLFYAKFFERNFNKKI